MQALVKAERTDFQGADLREADLSSLRGKKKMFRARRPISFLGIHVGGNQLRQLMAIRDTKIDFRGLNASGAHNLSGLDFTEIDLSRSSFEGAHLAGALFNRQQIEMLLTMDRVNWQGVDLSKAGSLSGLDFRGKNLKEARLGPASLSGLMLDHTQLKDLLSSNPDVSLSGLPLETPLTGIEINGKQFQELLDSGHRSFSGLNLSQADLSQIRMPGDPILLSGAKLGRDQILNLYTKGHRNFRGADFTNSNLRGLILDQADLTDTLLTNTQLDLAHVLAMFALGRNELKGVDLSQATLIGQTLMGISLEGVKLHRQQVEELFAAGRLDFKGAELSEVDFTHLPLLGASLEAVTLTQAQINQLFAAGRDDFTGVPDQGVHLPKTISRPILASNTNNALAPATTEDRLKKEAMRLDIEVRYSAGERHFEGIDLSGMDFRNTDLRDINLKNANLEGTLFDGANLSGAQLQGAQMNRLTSFSDQTQLTGALFFDAHPNSEGQAPQAEQTFPAAAIPAFLSLKVIQNLLRNTTLKAPENTPALIHPLVIQQFCEAYKADRKAKYGWAACLLGHKTAEKIEKLASHPAQQSLVLMKHFFESKQNNPKARTVQILETLAPHLSAPAA